jgi:hypothetical protein
VLVETAVIAALANWGIHTGDRSAAKIMLGIGAPAAGFGLWGAVDSHRSRLAEPLRLIEELVISGLAAVARYAAGLHVLGFALAALSVVYHALVYATGERLPKPRRDPPVGSSDGVSATP